MIKLEKIKKETETGQPHFSITHLPNLNRFHKHTNTLSQTFTVSLVATPTPARDDIHLHSPALGRQGAVDEHVQVQTLHEDPHVARADGIHKKHHQGPTFPELKKKPKPNPSIFSSSQTGHAHLGTSSINGNIFFHVQY